MPLAPFHLSLRSNAGENPFDEAKIGSKRTNSCGVSIDVDGGGYHYYQYLDLHKKQVSR